MAEEFKNTPKHSEESESYDEEEESSEEEYKDAIREEVEEKIRSSKVASIT